MDLTTQEVAKILGVCATDVQNWAEAGSLPHYQMEGELRFGQEELETWMLGHDEELEKACQKGQGEEGMGFQHYGLYRAINRGGVLYDIPGETKEEVIRSSMHEIAKRFDLDKDVLTELLLDREKLMSTGLGHGIAFPHTRDFYLEKRINVVTVVFPKKPLDFGAIDHEPVFALFFLLACDSKNHLHLLGKLAHMNHSTSFREFLKARPAQSDLLQHVRDWERSLIAPASFT